MTRTPILLRAAHHVYAASSLLWHELDAVVFVA